MSVKNWIDIENAFMCSGCTRVYEKKIDHGCNGVWLKIRIACENDPDIKWNEFKLKGGEEENGS